MTEKDVAPSQTTPGAVDPLALDTQSSSRSSMPRTTIEFPSRWLLGLYSSHHLRIHALHTLWSLAFESITPRATILHQFGSNRITTKLIDERDIPM